MSVKKVPLPDGLLEVEAVALALNVTVRAVQRWIADGLLPAVVLGSGNRTTFLIRRQDANRFRMPPRGRPKQKGR